MQTEIQKYQLIHRITQIENSWVLQQIENFVQQLTKTKFVWNKVVKPLRKTTSLEGLKLAQNYQKPSQEQVDSLVQELAIEEPIEDLLAQLSR